MVKENNLNNGLFKILAGVVLVSGLGANISKEIQKDYLNTVIQDVRRDLDKGFQVKNYETGTERKGLNYKCG